MTQTGKFNEISRKSYNLFLKECEWRFNAGLVKGTCENV